RSVWQPLSLLRLLELFDLPLARLALTMGAVQVVNLLSYRIELFVLDHYRGISRVGVYSIAVQTGEMLWIVAGAIATAVTAPLRRLRRRRSERARLCRRRSAGVDVLRAASAHIPGEPRALGNRRPMSYPPAGAKGAASRGRLRGRDGLRGAGSSAYGRRLGPVP